MNRLVIGSSDKNSFLLQCMQEDFADGFLLIDPTGALAEAAADRVPVELTERTLYLDPSDIGHPFGLNVLDGIEPDDRHRVAKDICAFFDVIFPEGPTTLTRAKSGYLLLNCLRLLMDAPNPSILSIPRLLSDGAYRTKCIGHCADPVVLKFWTDEFPLWKEDDLIPLRAKLGDLFNSPLLRNILGQRHSTFSLSGNHIIIANLNRAKLGDQVSFLLASLLVTRSTGPVYLNDFGFLAADYIASLLAQDRFTLALDYLDQLPRKLQQAVLAIADKTVFKTAREDAERLAFYLGVMNPSILTDLDPAEARTGGGVIRPTAPAAKRRLTAIRRRTRACFARPRLTVERAIRLHL